MQGGTRRWVVSAIVKIAIVGVGIAAIAAGVTPSLSGSHTADDAPSVLPETSVSPSPSETPAPVVAPSASPHPEESASPEPDEAREATHGRCVSHWVHEAKRAGLRGRFFGRFVRAVAHSDCAGADADFSAELQAALADQAAYRADHPKKPKHQKHNRP